MNLPEHGSEDVSSILALDLEQEPVQTINGIHKVEPDSHTYWLIDVEFSGFTMSDEEILHVHTGTEPGFFWLDTLAEDRFADLIFSMDVVRTVQPQTVFEAMWKSAEYARTRLGGTLVYENDLPSVPEHYLQQIQELEDRLSQFGFTPGEEVVAFLL
ncbi:cell division protein ZipA C-terminal FtsZ-binding domain-containing protein [Paenibacillus sp. 23TSA30-6]|uniref:cell division protein ZipA C-terminal FtsZ-binding domain-containing protein n=1 Tax=Paenibacillus sp. 23TSA30-6 TaxID=2546104 RepID=UPI0017882422|nr:cell division protein ZipA C-terminal FtsZ-binding domain-containing protein [Paenibacillus sp. 23TSA30-6]MBE0337048.1 hypothetical protein [Paenibacillus sp. 23TSA30-6]